MGDRLGYFILGATCMFLDYTLISAAFRTSSIGCGIVGGLMAGLTIGFGVIALLADLEDNEK